MRLAPLVEREGYVSEGPASEEGKKEKEKVGTVTKALRGQRPGGKERKRQLGAEEGVERGNNCKIFHVYFIIFCCISIVNTSCI